MGEVRIRWANVEDARGVALVHVHSWQVAYKGLIDQAVLDAQQVDQRTAAWTQWITCSIADLPTDRGASKAHRLLVAEEDRRIVGWASFGAGRDEGMHDMGELAGLYVHPEFWSQGVGHALISRVESELRDDQQREAYLWVLQGNDRASLFYERHGWKADGVEKIGDAGGARELRELRHVRRLAATSAEASSKFKRESPIWRP